MNAGFIGIGSMGGTLVRALAAESHGDLGGTTSRLRLFNSADAGLPKVVADRVQLQQVLMNLMLNGIEAMKDMGNRGELTIKSQQDDNRQAMFKQNHPSHRSKIVLAIKFAPPLMASGLVPRRR
jgi:nitrogen-specific signal transduction histidine kinase